VFVNRGFGAVLLEPFIDRAEVVVLALAEFFKLFKAQDHQVVVSHAYLVKSAFKKDAGHFAPPGLSLLSAAYTNNIHVSYLDALATVKGSKFFIFPFKNLTITISLVKEKIRIKFLIYLTAGYD
jgi:hypothetical protein